MSREVVHTSLSLPSVTSQRRTLDERLYVRFPTLLPRLVSAVMRLRTRSRLRRTFLSRLAQRGWAASDRGDLELCLCGYDPAVEITWPESGGRVFPDIRGTYHGIEGFRRVWRAMHEAWDVDVQLEEMMDGGDRVLLMGRLAAQGKGSGVRVGGPVIGLYTYRAGRIIREQYFDSREEALDALGLSE
jgi:ketosteroid isomerase-like protein